MGKTLLSQKRKANLVKTAIIIVLLIVYAYVCCVISIPNNIVIFEGESIGLKMLKGLELKSSKEYETLLTSGSVQTNEQSKTGSTTMKLSLFGGINLKEVNVDVLLKTRVIPVGTAIGMKLYTKGVLVVGMSQIENEEKQKEKPYENSGIEQGDIIISVNGNTVENTEDLVTQVNNSNGEKINIQYVRDNTTMETSITPVKSSNQYKIGLWVRDAAAGVGTVTFYEPSTNMFMSLGHGISDIDTEKIVEISTGELVTANILSINKGTKGKPGEIRGTIENGNTIGEIYKNTNFGVYGYVTNKQYLDLENKSEMEVASREEIQEGKAQIICQLDNSSPKTYEIEIEKVYKNNNVDNKSMLIKITDESLLEKTGGIIQGMSGAPIIQNGKFIGAVTNVLVNDPTQGYGVFGDILIKQIRQT